jgi:hypothetical protein
MTIATIVKMTIRMMIQTVRSTTAWSFPFGRHRNGRASGRRASVAGRLTASRGVEAAARVQRDAQLADVAVRGPHEDEAGQGADHGDRGRDVEGERETGDVRVDEVLERKSDDRRAGVLGGGPVQSDLLRLQDELPALIDLLGGDP